MGNPLKELKNSVNGLKQFLDGVKQSVEGLKEPIDEMKGNIQITLEQAKDRSAEFKSEVNRMKECVEETKLVVIEAKQTVWKS